MLKSYRKQQRNQFDNCCGDFGTPLHLDTIASRYLKPLLLRAALYLVGAKRRCHFPRQADHGRTYARWWLAERKKTRPSQRRPSPRSWCSTVSATRTPLGSTSWGVACRTSKDLLAHASSSTTCDSYTHSDAGSHSAALGALEDALLTKTGKLGIA